MAARRPEVPRRGRAALLGDDRRPADPLRRARRVRGEADGTRSVEGMPRAVPCDVCGREPESAGAAHRPVRPRLEYGAVGGVRCLLRAISEGKADAPEQILARWTWRLARASRKLQDRRASAEFPEAKRLLGALANSRGHRHEENAAKLVNAALEMPRDVGAALLASAEGYTPRATRRIDAARERLGTIQEVANALADNLPAPKAPGRSRRRRRKRK